MNLKNLAGDIVFSAAVKTVRELVLAAIKAKINLSGSNLSGSDLRNSNLRGSNLRGSNLSYSDLSYSDLRDSNLSGSDLSVSNLSGSNLRNSNLSGSDLSGSDLSYSDLRNSNLSGSDLRGSDLSYSDLRGSNLSGSNLRGSNLRDSNLSGSDLSGSNLRNSNLSGSKNIPTLAAAETIILPEGPIIGWKKCANDVIVKLLIPAKARKSNATGRKCRADFVRVLQVFGAEVGVSTHKSSVTYKTGETVTCDAWNEDRWTECGGGIHFFITRVEAEKY